MKKGWLSLLIAALAFCAVNASAEGARVIDEEIVMQDPTVAAGSRWAVGASVEQWYISGPYGTKDSAGNQVSKGTIGGTQPGGNFFVGYGNLTLQYSHRKGRFKIAQAYGVGGTSNAIEVLTEDEVTLRYLFKVSRHFSPYVLAGYNGTKRDQSEALTNNFVWTYNNSADYHASTTYNTALIGGGAIVPFTSRFGARADVRLLVGSGKYKRDDGFTSKGSAAGAAFTATAYYNVIGGLNIQAGGKMQGLGSKKAGGYFRGGIFGSLGYSHKF